ncbi:MAG: type II toxin-antitoxin system RelE/ParE family toxin [Rhodomicrobium sp.]
MILGFRDKRTAAFACGERIAAFQSIERQAYRRLDVLDAATCLEDLRALRSNNLEMLKGDRKTQYSIRINRQWRICFEWREGDAGPSNVEIVDYHQEINHGPARNAPRRSLER